MHTSKKQLKIKKKALTNFPRFAKFRVPRTGEFAYAFCKVRRVRRINKIAPVLWQNNSQLQPDFSLFSEDIGGQSRRPFFCSAPC